MKIKKSRRLQAVIKGYTDAQKGCVDRLKAAWTKQFSALETSYNLNKKFHTVEFVEFELDGHKLKDMKAIFDNKALSLWEMQAIWNPVNMQYWELRKAAAKVINGANGARGKAQKDVRTADNAVNVAKGDRACGYFKWATMTG